MLLAVRPARRRCRASTGGRAAMVALGLLVFCALGGAVRPRPGRTVALTFAAALREPRPVLWRVALLAVALAGLCALSIFEVAPAGLPVDLVSLRP